MHWWLTPQPVPFATGLPVSLHTAVPPEQSSVPVSHALVGVHGAFCVQVVQSPALHTMLAPHDVPFGAGLPVSVHTGVPVEQLIVPESHGLPGGAHEAFSVQAMHAPFSQSWFVPQEVPLVTGTLVSLHAGTPDAHVVVPMSHALVGVHGAFAVHETQAPPLHTMFVPHDTPLAPGPVSLHTGVPVVHHVVPVSHPLAGVHAAFAVQGPHVPLSQTMLVPHDAPFGPGRLPSAQTAVPVEHETFPVSHALAGVHVAPAAHAVHAPALHTMPAPHTVPLTACAPVSAHAPVAHVRLPVSHALDGTQAAPSTHATHAPLSQTWPLPHEIPFCSVFGVGTHVETPVAQLVTESTQTPVGVQGVPAVQALHVPALQTMLVPHAVPFGAGLLVSVHVGEPVEHEVAPRSQGLAGVHEAPVGQAEHAPPWHTIPVPHGVPFGAGLPVGAQADTPFAQVVA